MTRPLTVRPCGPVQVHGDPKAKRSVSGHGGGGLSPFWRGGIPQAAAATKPFTICPSGPVQVHGEPAGCAFANSQPGGGRSPGCGGGTPHDRKSSADDWIGNSTMIMVATTQHSARLADLRCM